jgi:hypothetical protein
MIELVRAVYEYDDQRALSYAKEANALALQLADSAKIVNSYRTVGQLYVRLAMSKEAEMVLSKALPIAARNNFRADQKKMLSNLAIPIPIRHAMTKH